MLKMIVTDALISKGYEGAPALRFSDKDGTSLVTFRIGKRIYDKRAKDSHRWINLSVKGFNHACERIRSMKLDAGSSVNIIGRYDEDTWEDQATKEKKSAPVLIIDEIEFGGSGQNGKAKQAGADNGDGAPAGQGNGSGAPAENGQSHANPAAAGQQVENFTGFEAFGGANPYYPDN